MLVGRVHGTGSQPQDTHIGASAQSLAVKGLVKVELLGHLGTDSSDHLYPRSRQSGLFRDLNLETIASAVYLIRFAI